MIPFFRKIRKQFADDNKPLKYMRYAIGEIVLVVVGILIALQINNWNEEFQNKSLEIKALENLKKDLVIQREIILSQQAIENSILTTLDSCSVIMSSTFQPVAIDRFLNILIERQTFIANRVTFDNLGVIGNMVTINNSELRNNIVRYYQELDYTTSVINNNNLYRTNSQFGTFVVTNSLEFRLNEDTLLDSNYSLSSENRYTLKKQLDARRYSSKNNLGKCNLLFASTEKLIQQIDKELNNY